MKKQYIAPISEKVFPDTIMWNPGKGGGIIHSGSNISSKHIICAPGRSLYM